MKLIIKSIIFVLFCQLSFSVGLKSSSSTETIAGTKEDFTSLWKTLFTSINRPPSSCIRPDHLYRTKEDKKPDDYGIQKKMPQEKTNIYYKGNGIGESAYLFDYFDSLLQDAITKEFDSMYNAAKSMSPPPANEYADPYSIDKLLFMYSQGTEGGTEALTPAGPVARANTMTPQEQMERIKNYSKTFNPAIFEKGISPAQVYSLVTAWGWKKPSWADTTTDDWARRTLDDYDFDGDGRLSISEFLLMSIVVNKGNFRSPTCLQFCHKYGCNYLGRRG